jgi:hypothetical protein
LENEEELLDVYFAVPAADSINSKFLTTAEISEKLISAGNKLLDTFKGYPNEIWS